MLKLKNLTLKNYMSFGNVDTEVSLDEEQLTLILGENRDVTQNGSFSDSRNGTGKCVCLNTIVKVRNTKTGEIYETTVGDLYCDVKKQP
jgi:predicted ATP-binding protein involved in virulence